MPVCPQCSIAYLDGESHTCQTRVDRFVVWRWFRVTSLVFWAVLTALVQYAYTPSGHLKLQLIVFGDYAYIPPERELAASRHTALAVMLLVPCFVYTSGRLVAAAHRRYRARRTSAAGVR